MTRLFQKNLQVPSVIATAFSALISSCLALHAQVPARPQQAPKVPPVALSLAYRYAFRVYAVENEQAAAQEFKGESGIALRDTLRLRFELTAEQFAPFENAALDNGQLEGLIEAVSSR